MIIQRDGTIADPGWQMRWSDSYLVGVDAIDDQHRQLFAICDELRDSIDAGEGSGRFGQILERLGQYTCEHFRDEEALMDAAGYPGRAAHRREHARFIAYIERERKSYASGEIHHAEVLRFLRDWLTRHVVQDDQTAADFYLERLPPPGWFARIFGRPR